MRSRKRASKGLTTMQETTSTEVKHVPLLQHAAPLSRQWPVWFCDIWGIVHDGVRADEVSCDALVRHRREGGVVILVSNSPRPRPALLKQLDELRVPRESHDDVITSGDVTRAIIARYAGRNVFHLGPERDAHLREGLPVNFGGPDEAEVVMCSGLFDDRTEQPEQYRPMLERLAARHLPFVCANPDLVVKHGERILPCAGALAAIYEELGGEVVMAGKPFLPIYEEALRKAGAVAGHTVEKQQILAIGDGIGTDMKGAANFGIAAVFVAGGISEGALDEHGVDELATRIRKEASGLNLVGIMRRLQW